MGRAPQTTISFNRRIVARILVPGPIVGNPEAIHMSE